MKKYKYNNDVFNGSSIRGRIEILEENKKLIKVIPMHSLLKNFTIGMAYRLFSTGISGQVNNIGASVGPSSTTLYCINSSATYIHAGVVIGTGVDPAPSIDTYALNSIITTTNFNFFEATSTNYESGTTKQIRITRRFYNKSASPIDITEIGLTAYLSSTTYVLLAYDILDASYSFVNDTYVYFSIILTDSVTYDIMPNFFKILYNRLTNVNVSLVDITNASSVLTSAYIVNCAAPADNTNYGVQIGSGTTVNNSSTYVIATNLTLTNNACSISRNNNVLTISRQFTNNTGGNVIIKQIALVVYCVNITKYILIYRKVLAEVNYITVQSDDVALVEININVSPS